MLSILFNSSPVLQRTNPFQYYSIIGRFQAKVKEIRNVMFGSPLQDYLSFTGNRQDINEKTEVFSYHNFIKKQIPQKLSELDRDWRKTSVMDDLENHHDFFVVPDKTPLHWSLQNDGLVSTSQDEHISRISAFLYEFEHNLEIIKEFAGEKLLPLETSFWDANQTLVSVMTPDLKHDLKGIYDDITLLNNLVWLSTEFNRISPNMRTQYIKLIGIIAFNLEKVLKVAVFHHQVEIDLAST